jgi:integrase
MPTAKLDASFCLTAQCKPGGKRTDYYDTSISGFVLECHKSGSKTYSLRYPDAYGRQRQRKIGVYGIITFDQARRVARRWRSEAELGGDPAGDKAIKKSTPTYAELAAQHIEFARSHQKTPANTESVLRVHALPRWGSKRVDEITTPEVAKWLSEKRAAGLAPATVEKIRITFNRSFELALKWGVPGVTKNPVRHIPRRKFSNARDRFLTSQEAARLLEATSASINPQLRNIVGLLLLTGARKTELLTAQWQHIDLDRRVWFIPTSKTGKSRHVPLSQPAIAIINQLDRWNSCDWLLPNPATKKPYTDIKHPWETARAAAGLPDLHIHDLRHSAASYMINAGIDLFAVGRILGHADHQSTMRYAHLANDTLMKAVEAGAIKMAADWISSPAAAA